MKKCQSGILMEMTINDNYSVIINNTKQYKIKLLKPYSIIKMIQNITPGLPGLTCLHYCVCFGLM